MNRELINIIVAAFNDPSSTPAKGSSQFAGKMGDYEFHFASKANLDAFEANATKYAPQVGGFCSWGVSGFDRHGGSSGGLWYACTSDAGCYEVAKYDGKLYFYLNSGAKSQMQAKGKDAYDGANKNFAANFISPEQPFCFNTEMVKA